MFIECRMILNQRFKGSDFRFHDILRFFSLFFDLVSLSFFFFGWCTWCTFVSWNYSNEITKEFTDICLSVSSFFILSFSFLARRMFDDGHHHHLGRRRRRRRLYHHNNQVELLFFCFYFILNFLFIKVEKSLDMIYNFY